jgi:trehalose 6-phosphate synthase
MFAAADHEDAMTESFDRLVVVNDRNLFQPGRVPGLRQQEADRPGWVPRHDGLAAGLTAGAGACGLPAVFVSSARSPAERRLAPGPGTAVAAGDGTGVLRLASIPPRQYRAFYDRFANSVLWLAHHDALRGRAECEAGLRAFTSGYVAVNESLARLVIAEVGGELERTCTVWQDYQLYLAPLMVRRSLSPAARSRYTSVHFIHVPFPPVRAWRFFPDAVMERLLTGLLGNDAVWFHLDAYARNFVAAACRYVPGAIAENRSVIHWQGRRISVGANPLPANVAHLRALAADGRTDRHRDEIQTTAAGRRVIFSTGRVDPLKGYAGLLDSFAQMLEDGREDAILIARWYRSRMTIPRWRATAAGLSRAAAAINQRYGHVRPGPVQLSLDDDMFGAVAGYAEYDVLDVTPDADGMNLVSLEGPAVNTRCGQLVLSSGAGSSELFGDAALTIPPACEPRRHAAALTAMVDLPMTDRAARAGRLRDVALAGDPQAWFARLLRTSVSGTAS